MNSQKRICRLCINTAAGSLVDTFILLPNRLNYSYTLTVNTRDHPFGHRFFIHQTLPFPRHMSRKHVCLPPFLHVSERLKLCLSQRHYTSNWPMMERWLPRSTWGVQHTLAFNKTTDAYTNTWVYHRGVLLVFVSQGWTGVYLPCQCGQEKCWIKLN